MRDNQKGQAVVMVLLLTTAVFVIGCAALALSLSATRSAAREVNQKQAYYIAEAGVRQGLKELMFRVNSQEPESVDSFVYIENPGQAYLTGGQEGKLDSVSVVREDSNGNIFIIRSKAHYPDPPGPMTACRGIEARVQVAVDPFIWSDSIGSGIKAGGNVDINGVISSMSGALVARTGDVEFSDILFSGISGGIYSGHNVILGGGLATSGQGDIRALNDVIVKGDLFGLFPPTWNGRVWYGGTTNLPASERVIRTDNIPGFPLPPYPKIDKSSNWYKTIKDAAIKNGRYYESYNDFYAQNCVIEKGIPLLGIFSTAILTIPPGISVVEGTMYLSEKGFYDAGYRPGLIPLSTPKIICKQPATIVADDIIVDGGLLPLLGLGIDMRDVTASLGLFAVDGDVDYHAQFGSGGSLAVLTNGNFNCRAIAGTPIFDWVVAKENVEIDSAFEFNQAVKDFPPGTPCGYKILSWREVPWQED